MMWWLLLGCGTNPLVNDPPRLLSFNGQEPSILFGFARVEIERPVYGEVVELVVEVDDPENDDVLIYFPAAEGVIDFEPTAREGTWTAPMFDVVGLNLYLRDDDRNDPAGAEVSIEFGFDGRGDTGIF